MPTPLAQCLLPVLSLDWLIGLSGRPRRSRGGSSGAGRHDAYNSGFPSTQ
jgi:hypothetical protein